MPSRNSIALDRAKPCSIIRCPECDSKGTQLIKKFTFYQDFCALFLGVITFPILLGYGFFIPYWHSQFKEIQHVCKHCGYCFVKFGVFDPPNAVISKLDEETEMKEREEEEEKRAISKKLGAALVNRLMGDTSLKAERSLAGVMKAMDADDDVDANPAHQQQEQKDGEAEGEGVGGNKDRTKGRTVVQQEDSTEWSD